MLTLLAHRPPACSQYEEFIDYYNKFVVGHRRQFEDTYELGSQIGKGAFGNVYRARRIGGDAAAPGSVAAGQQVAVKRIKKQAGVPMELVHNEITIWKQLDHPNLVGLLDVFETDVELCLVTELMRGGDLFHCLLNSSTFSESDAARLARQIVSAVAHLHVHGVVHCDLKPSNILVAEKDVDRRLMTVKIADFGLSQSLHMAGGAGKLTEVCGTPDYFAPELADIAQGRASVADSDREEFSSLLEAEGKGYGPPLDCWAVGCIIYELLAGHPPYQAKDEAVLFYKITENAMDFPRQPFDETSAEVVDLIRQLTRTDPRTGSRARTRWSTRGSPRRARAARPTSRSPRRRSSRGGAR